ncbi:hypothetical protein VM636_14580 [Streptomyces sp. SCSIO 75703]|uniref:hypothetical protein n=1 Tax=Streptomyces sp. SCSIO 75703 TaxID=3112165 RepID=UPI000AE2799C
MVEPVVVVVALAGARLVYALVALWTRPAWERSWAHAVATVVRASGPGGVVEVTRADGDRLTARRAAKPTEPTEPTEPTGNTQAPQSPRRDRAPGPSPAPATIRTITRTTPQPTTRTTPRNSARTTRRTTVAAPR